MGKASRKKQKLYRGVDGEGRPLFPADEPTRSSLAGVPLSWLLAVVTVGLWIGAHLLGPGGSVVTAVYIVFGVTLGITNPALAAVITMALVPFEGGAGEQGLSELSRSVPIIGAAVRLLWDRFAHRERSSHSWQPNLLLVGAAVIALVLYPVTRITANGADWAPASRLVDDLLFMFGAPAAAYASWIVFSHLPKDSVDRILRVLPFTLAVALLVGIAAWAGLELVAPFAFDGVVYGRLGALGYPTPTAMGVAISLPLAIGALWFRSTRGSLALIVIGIVVIFLTQSRGPLIALLVAGGAIAILKRQIPRRYLVAGFALAVSALALLLLVRYPDLLRKLSNGRLPSVRGDELRVISWIAAIQIALANPLTGGGWMSVR